MITNPSLSGIIQAVLLAATQPVPLRHLVEVSGHSGEEIESCLKEIQTSWKEHEVLQIHQTGAGWRISIRGEFAPYLQKFFEQKPQKLSKAVLETLALIAYRQPITRSEIEEVRGVAVNPATIRQLMDLEWVSVVGQKEVPGRPQLFGTTKKFLSDFQLKSLKQLPEYQTAAAEMTPEVSVPELETPPQDAALEVVESDDPPSAQECPQEPQ